MAEASRARPLAWVEDAGGDPHGSPRAARTAWAERPRADGASSSEEDLEVSQGGDRRSASSSSRSSGAFAVGRRVVKVVTAVGAAALLAAAGSRARRGGLEEHAAAGGTSHVEAARIGAVVQDSAESACYDGTYEGREGLKSFFWSFGTTWEWWEHKGGGLMATEADRRDQPHHMSILRSSTFVVSPSTRFSVLTRGGTGNVTSLKGRMSDFSGPTSPQGFLGVSIWQKDTGMWVVSKRRTQAAQDQDEELTFGPNELAPLIGLEVTIDVIDTYDGMWGWLLVRSLRLEGTCGGGEVAIAAPQQGMAGEGEECSFEGQDGLHSIFGSVGGDWTYQPLFGGGYFSAKESQRDLKHAKTVFRSVPIHVADTTSFTLVTRGGHGARRDVRREQASVVGDSRPGGFLGVAVRDVVTDQWLASKTRSGNDSQDEDEAITFSPLDLQELVGQTVTIDVIDDFHGDWGWIMVKKFTLHGPCASTQTNVPLAWSTTRAPPIVLQPTATPSDGLTYFDESGKCKVRRSDATPRLYCFSVMTKYEIPLIAEQFKRKISIFQCNDYNVISVIPMSIGTDECGEPFYTWLNEVKMSRLGNVAAGQATSSFLNTATFILAWDTLIAGGKVPRNDWIVKVDPDCVFFPNRLRQHLAPHTGKPVMVKNCALYGVKLFGALEAFSEPAINIYMGVRDKCKSMPWGGWGEDLYMERCLLDNGATSVQDFQQVGDNRCHGVPCTDASVAAYHPFKDVDSWLHCWDSSPK